MMRSDRRGGDLVLTNTEGWGGMLLTDTEVVVWCGTEKQRSTGVVW